MGEEGLPEGWARWSIEAIEPGARRSADELMLIRGKIAAALVSRRVLERPAGSRLRKRVLSSAVRAGFALMNRRDYSTMFDVIYTDDYEMAWEGVFLDAGDAGVQHGRGEVGDYLEALGEVYSSIVYRPLEIVDPGGTHIAAAIDTVLTGRSSGIESRVVQGITYEIEGTLVRRQFIFRDFDSALVKLREMAGAD